MKTYKNFKKYIPVEKKHGDNVLYLLSDEGIDWYDCQSEFRQDTLKVQYSDDGYIAQASYDVTLLVPYGYSVSELEHDGDEDEVVGKIYDGSKISDYVESTDEKIKRLSSEHQELRTVAINELNNIKMAIDLEVATDYEIELFPKLKAYVLELSSLTTSEFSKKKFSFPVKPV